MNYTKLASEARKLYSALRDEEFDANQAYEITKVCVRDYPIFREMIEEERTPENAIGYVSFVNGSKEPIYKVVQVTSDTIEFHTKDGAYRKYTYHECTHYPFNDIEKHSYSKFIDKEWKNIYTIHYIELF